MCVWVDLMSSFHAQNWFVGVQPIKLFFSSSLTKKLECFSSYAFSAKSNISEKGQGLSLPWTFEVRIAPGFTCKSQTRLERFCRDKDTSRIRDKGKRFCNIYNWDHLINNERPQQSKLERLPCSGAYNIEIRVYTQIEQACAAITSTASFCMGITSDED